TLKKIKADFKSQAYKAQNEDDSIRHIQQKWLEKLSEAKYVGGAIQFCSTIPSLIVIVFTEASLRLYNALVHQPGTVVSWDATGSIVRNNNNDLRLYYELTLSVPNTAPHDRLIPISFLIPSDHSQPIIDFWLSKLKYGYKVIFLQKTFPVSKYMISDRSFVLIRASLHQFNEESYRDYFIRAFKIVNDDTSQINENKTIIISCTAHMMKHFRIKIVNKFLVKELHELGMWSLSLLLNTSHWNDMLQN
ncbi:unnamed protein product, partial [Didymodactylos carnosus]